MEVNVYNRVGVSVALWGVMMFNVMNARVQGHKDGAIKYGLMDFGG